MIMVMPFRLRATTQTPKSTRMTTTLMLAMTTGAINVAIALPAMLLG